MSRIRIPTKDESPAASLPILNEIERKFGTIPNLFRLLGLSPHGLKSYAGLTAALGLTFDPKIREQIAIAVAQVNGCDYCLSAHAYLGMNLAGLSEADVALARKGSATDPSTSAIIRFASLVTTTRGQIGDHELAAIREAGLHDAQIIELVCSVAENVLTNFLNNVAQTTVDFPALQVSDAA